MHLPTDIFKMYYYKNTMSSALGDKKGRVANSSDLTRLRRQTAELAAYATCKADGNAKKISAQSGTTAGILAVKTAAVTTVDAATTSKAVNPVTKTVVSGIITKITRKH